MVSDEYYKSRKSGRRPASALRTKTAVLDRSEEKVWKGFLNLLKNSVRSILSSQSGRPGPGASICKGAERDRALQLLGIVFVPSMLALYFCSMVEAENNPARTQGVFPIVINTEPVKHLDDFWRSEFQVFNSNPDPVTVTFTVFDSNSVVQEMASVTINCFNFGAPVFRQPVVKGWVRVMASLPVLLRETIDHRVFIAGIPPPGTSFTTSTLDQAPPLLATRRQFIEIVRRPTTGTRRFTGLSIVFPSDDRSSIANGKLIHRWVDGRKVSEKNIQLRANGQLVGLLTELLPPESLTLSPYLAGSLEITSDKDVFISVIEFFPASIYATANPVQLADKEHLSVPLSGTF